MFWLAISILIFKVLTLTNEDIVKLKDTFRHVCNPKKALVTNQSIIDKYDKNFAKQQKEIINLKAKLAYQKLLCPTTDKDNIPTSTTSKTNTPLEESFGTGY